MWCLLYILNVIMQGSVAFYQTHIKQTAFRYLLLLKADSQETVQTHQCSHTYYYPTPSSCLRFVSSINTHLPGEERTWTPRVPGLWFRGCIGDHFAHVVLSQRILIDLSLVTQHWFCFWQQFMSSLANDLSSWPGWNCVVERLFLLVLPQRWFSVCF